MIGTAGAIATRTVKNGIAMPAKAGMANRDGKRILPTCQIASP
jgi:hypothetical protein